MSGESKTDTTIINEQGYFAFHKSAISCLSNNMNHVEQILRVNEGKPINMTKDLLDSLIAYVTCRTFLENNGVFSMNIGVTFVDNLLFGGGSLRRGEPWNKQIVSTFDKTTNNILNQIKSNNFFLPDASTDEPRAKRVRKGGHLKNKRKSRSQKGGMRKKDILVNSDVDYYDNTDRKWHLSKVINIKDDRSEITLRYIVQGPLGGNERDVSIKIGDIDGSSSLRNIRRPGSGLIKGVSYLTTAALAYASYKAAIAVGAVAGIDATLSGLSTYSLELLKSMNILKPQCNGMYDIASNIFVTAGGTIGDSCSRIAMQNQNKIANLTSYISGLLSAQAISLTPSALKNNFFGVASGIESAIDKQVDRKNNVCDSISRIFERRRVVPRRPAAAPAAPPAPPASGVPVLGASTGASGAPVLGAATGASASVDAGDRASGNKRSRGGGAKKRRTQKRKHPKQKGKRKSRKKQSGGAGPCTEDSSDCCLKDGIITEDGHLGPLDDTETPDNIIQHGFADFMDEYEDCSHEQSAEAVEAQRRKNLEYLKKEKLRRQHQESMFNPHETTPTNRQDYENPGLVRRFTDGFTGAITGAFGMGGGRKKKKSRKHKKHHKKHHKKQTHKKHHKKHHKKQTYKKHPKHKGKKHHKNHNKHKGKKHSKTKKH